MKKTDCVKNNNLAIVADENRKNNRRMCEFLKGRGYGTISAFRFSDAVVLIQRISPDLVVLDSSFHDAEDIVDLLKVNKQTKDVPVLMTSKDMPAGNYFPGQQHPAYRKH